MLTATLSPDVLMRESPGPFQAPCARIRKPSEIDVFPGLDRFLDEVAHHRRKGDAFSLGEAADRVEQRFLENQVDPRFSGGQRPPPFARKMSPWMQPRSDPFGEVGIDRPGARFRSPRGAFLNSTGSPADEDPAETAIRDTHHTCHKIPK